MAISASLMQEMIYSILIGTGALSLALVLAIILTYIRPFKPLLEEKKIQLIKWIVLGLAIHSLHLSEEFATGFYVRFPKMFELTPWTAEFFVLFNLTWMAIWSVSIIGIWKDRRIALIPIWFFAIGSLGNVIAHPIFALSQGGYFPGLWTSLLAGWIGFNLIRRLW